MTLVTLKKKEKKNNNNVNQSLTLPFDVVCHANPQDPFCFG